VRRLRPAARGFGLLEAVVALALFALVGSALFAWIDTNLDAASRLRQRDESQRDLQLALAWVQTVNPMARPSGDAEPEPGTRLRWQARALTAATPVAPLPGGTWTPFRVAMFEVDVTVSRANGSGGGSGGGSERRFVLRRIGVDREAPQSP
jgi:type II secretory pathway pseudopilin PulG